MMQVKDIRNYFINELQAQRFVTDKTGVKTIELVGASFIADEPMIFGKPNADYIERELAWYKSMSLLVDDIPGDTPQIWEDISSDSGYINSNYGYLIYHPGNHVQYSHVLQELLDNPNSRRAVMIYTRPTIWKEYDHDHMSDFICTNAVQYMIRDGRMHAVVQMRSNDVVFGYRNDYAWQEYVLKQLTDEYNDITSSELEVGDISWQVGSLHVYERHFKFIEAEIEARKL